MKILNDEELAKLTTVRLLALKRKLTPIANFISHDVLDGCACSICTPSEQKLLLRDFETRLKQLITI